MAASEVVITQTREDAEFPQELPGWNGYVEWENYPERKARASEIMQKHDFADSPEFQLVPLPKTNPILEGVRWKQYHEALGLGEIPKASWETVKKEKAKDMLHVLDFPYNGEPERERLVQDAFTRNEDFFVRNHGGIPYIDEDAYRLDIGGLVKEPKRLTMAMLKDESMFPRMNKVVTLQCSGTRRLEQIQQYPGEGDELINAPWGEGAIGNARWVGVSLKKVIKYCGGLKDGAGHVEFYGADTYFKKKQAHNYVVSVPWYKVQRHEVMLAWEMNGEPLPRIHGFPLRVVVMGVIGARSVKWLTRIKAIPHESKAPVQSKEYLYYTSQIGKHNVAYSSGFSIQDMPVSSAIMTPVNMDVIVHSGSIKCTGWAYSGGGQWPVRVELSPDGGHIWYQVPLENMSEKYFFGWRVWHSELPLDAEGWIELCVRTWDSANNTQPTFVRSAWNWDLHVTSSVHRLKLYSVNESKPATARRLQQMKEKGVSLTPITKPLPFELESEEEFQANWDKQHGRDPVE